MKQINVILLILFSSMVLSCTPSNKKSIDRLNAHIEKVEKNIKRIALRIGNLQIWSLKQLSLK